MELGASEKAAMSLSLAKGFAIVFDPVTHSSLFLNVDGEETRERRNLSLVFADAHSHNGTQAIQPGPVRISFDNKTVRRTLPGIWIHSEEMDKLDQPAPAVSDRDPSAQQPGVPRSLSQRDVRSRAAVQDHQPHDPVH